MKKIVKKTMTGILAIAFLLTTIPVSAQTSDEPLEITNSGIAGPGIWLTVKDANLSDDEKYYAQCSETLATGEIDLDNIGKSPTKTVSQSEAEIAINENNEKFIQIEFGPSEKGALPNLDTGIKYETTYVCFVGVLEANNQITRNSQRVTLTTGPKNPTFVLESNPEAVNGVLKVNVGDTIKFSGYQGDYVGSGQMHISINPVSIMECRDDDLKTMMTDIECTVKEKGTSYIKMYFTRTVDDTNVTSNAITVTTGPKVTPADGKTVVTLPPANFEDEVLVKTEEYENPFADTNLTTQDGKAAAELYRRGVIGGFKDGKFKGYRPVNRAEAAKFLLLARFQDVNEVSNDKKFKDVLDKEWYTKFVVTAAKKGIINGYSDGTFHPERSVTTAEFLKMLTLTFELETDLVYSYKDVSKGEWYAKYAGIAEKYELFPDRKEKLEPGKPLRRSEVAIAIYQFLNNR